MYAYNKQNNSSLEMSEKIFSTLSMSVFTYNLHRKYTNIYILTLILGNVK